MITGRKPFDLGSPVATALAQVNDPPPELPATVPLDLREVIDAVPGQGRGGPARPTRLAVAEAAGVSSASLPGVTPLATAVPRRPPLPTSTARSSRRGARIAVRDPRPARHDRPPRPRRPPCPPAPSRVARASRPSPSPRGRAVALAGRDAGPGWRGAAVASRRQSLRRPRPRAARRSASPSPATSVAAPRRASSAATSSRPRRAPRSQPSSQPSSPPSKRAAPASDDASKPQPAHHVKGKRKGKGK